MPSDPPGEHMIIQPLVDENVGALAIVFVAIRATTPVVPSRVPVALGELPTEATQVHGGDRHGTIRVIATGLCSVTEVDVSGKDPGQGHGSALATLAPKAHEQGAQGILRVRF